jgi:thiol-disulfide isomerase/thioredoxin
MVHPNLQTYRTRVFAALAFLMLLPITSASAQRVRTAPVRVIKFDQLKAMIDAQTDTTYIFNFWATWCAPCVKEFPNFQKISKRYQSKKVRVIFVSLDFVKDLKKKLTPFVKEHAVTNDVYLLDEPDYNTWIDRVDSGWEGNLPSTLIINNATGKRKIYPIEFTEAELESALKEFIP